MALKNGKMNAKKWEGLTMVSEVFDELYQRTILAYLDLLILQELNNTPQTTKDLLLAINTK